MSFPIRLIDRTRTVQDWKCPRSRYWGYEYLGRGIVKTGTSLELFMGITIHDALAAIAAGLDIDQIADAARLQMVDNITSGGTHTDPDTLEFAYEQGALCEGLIRGFYKHLWPKLMTLYPKIVATEAEMEWELAPGYIFMTKPDLVVEDHNGDLVYIEYKSTSSKKDKWINSWDTAVQLHSSIKATEATLNRSVSAVQIVGLYKGYESYGKQTSPFCYAYKKNGNPPFTQDQIEYSYKAGYKRYPTWELPGGTKSWVEGMPDNVLADQFPLTAPIFVNDDLVDAFFRQRAVREAQIASFPIYRELEEEHETRAMDEVFPQHFDQCVPSFGWECPYKKLCHGMVADPLTEGFELRTPHHQRETELLNV